MSPELAYIAPGVPDTHTTTQQWQSFEVRMRRRRVERCVLRASIALEAGVLDDAREVLAEARALEPEHPGVRELIERVAAVEVALSAPPRRARAWPAVAAVLALAAAGGGVWLWTLATGGTSERPAVVVSSAEVAPVRVVPEAVQETAAAEPRAADVSGAESSLPTADPPEVLAVERPSVLVAPAAERPAPPAGAAAGRQQPAARAGSAVPSTGPPTNRAPGEVAASDTGEAAAEPPPASTAPPGPPPAPSSVTARLEPLAVPLPAAPVEPPSRPRVETVERPPGDAPAAVPAGTSGVTGETAGSAVGGGAVVDERLVRATLARYAAAYSSLDAAAAGAVYPAVDRRALERAFSGLASQDVALGNCQVRVAGSSAQADCSGSARWTPRVGGGMQTAARRWRFELKNSGGEWVIEQTTVR